jgi:predicted DNA-binding transcriptional regulator AlpA
LPTLKLIPFEGICELGLANNWTTLNRRIANEGFPPGKLIGRRRVWTESSVVEWVESRPTAKAPLRGFAKRLKNGGGQ